MTRPPTSDLLAEITNITAIRAVVANGRYHDRTVLDRLVTDARATLKQRYDKLNQH